MFWQLRIFFLIGKWFQEKPRFLYYLTKFREEVFATADNKEIFLYDYLCLSFLPCYNNRTTLLIVRTSVIMRVFRDRLGTLIKNSATSTSIEIPPRPNALHCSAFPTAYATLFSKKAGGSMSWARKLWTFLQHIFLLYGFSS